ncbi:MAG: hypothetical protein ACHQU0_02830 [Candidatus Paceibacteria bacterium]
MLNLWKYNAIAFALQLITILIASMLTSDISLVLGFATLVPFIGIALPARFSLLRLALLNAAFGTFYVTMTLLIFMANTSGGWFVVLCVVYAMAYNARSLAEEVHEKNPNESLTLLNVVALTLGIGMVIGGPILLYRRYYRHQQISNV